MAVRGVERGLRMARVRRGSRVLGCGRRGQAAEKRADPVSKPRAGVASVCAGDDRLDAVGVWVIERLAVLAGKAADRDAVLEQAAFSLPP